VADTESKSGNPLFPTEISNQKAGRIGEERGKCKFRSEEELKSGGGFDREKVEKFGLIGARSAKQKTGGKFHEKKGSKEGRQYGKRGKFKGN